MVNIQELSKNLVLKEGIWSVQQMAAISYPEDGNETSFQLEEQSFWFTHRNLCIQSLVQQYAPTLPFYDIGGGNGYVSLGLQSQGFDTILIEPGAKGVWNAKQRGIKHLICSSLEDAQIQESVLDSVGLFDVIEHIDDDASFLQRIHWSMKRGAYVFATVPAYQWLWSKEDDDAGHFRRHTQTSMRDLLEKAGFEVVYNTYIFSFLPLPILLFRSLPSRLGLHKNSNDLAKHQDEHQNKGMLSSFFDKVLAWELKRVKQQKSMALGGSVLIVGRKK
jgi:2-polyprenyl-3-methyl-5-hydroxy-6-metoxy-1,4-benzoquinol methylase